MSLKYVFDVDAHTTQCMFAYDQNVGRLLEVFCYSRFPNDGPGWRYLGNSAGMVIALIAPDLSRNKAAQQLRQLHDEVCDNGIRAHEFQRQGWYEWTKSTPAPELGRQKLEFSQDYVSEPVAMLVRGMNNRMKIEHSPVYSGAFRPDQIQFTSVLQAYEVAVTIGRGTPPSMVMRRLRRFIRHVERYGLDECNTRPCGLRALGRDYDYD